VSSNSCFSSTSRFSTCDWIETSSADTGSSATIELRLQHERARDPDPLALAAAELVRVAVGSLGAQADALEHVGDELVAVAPRHAVDREPLADELLDRHPRVERADGVLEDDLHVAARGLQLDRDERRHVGALEEDLAAVGSISARSVRRASTCRSPTRRRGRPSRRRRS
jgi:hypothetical protein